MKPQSHNLRSVRVASLAVNAHGLVAPGSLALAALSEARVLPPLSASNIIALPVPVKDSRKASLNAKCILAKKHKRAGGNK